MEKRVAIVTHVCELAGLATAQALARDGMTVVCHDATFGDGTVRREFETTHPGLIARAEQEPEALVQGVIRDFGHVDVLYSNDIFPAQFVPVEDTSLDQFRATLEGLLVMPFGLCRALAPHMKARRTGNIILFYPRDLFENNVEVKAYLHAHVPAQRLGEQTELAELVAFLASGKCNFVNGQQIPFTGAWPGMPKWPATFK